MYSLLMMFFLLIFVLVSIAFFTFLERKILSYIQFRKGPNSVGILGLMQAFADAIKLIFKVYSDIMSLKILSYYFFPSVGVIMMVVIWMTYGKVELYSLGFSVLIYILISSMGSYFMIGVGYFVKSVLSMIGAIRGVAQLISYEVMVIFMLLMFGLLMNFFVFSLFQYKISKFWLGGFYFLIGLSLMIGLCETNRSPFDFSEGESELVSGFNTEYGGMMFSLIFMAEYGLILYYSFMIMIFFFDIGLSIMFSVVYSMFFLWVRGSFPRMRYDLMMILGWMKILPYLMLMLLLMLLMF